MLAGRQTTLLLNVILTSWSTVSPWKMSFRMWEIILSLTFTNSSCWILASLKYCLYWSSASITWTRQRDDQTVFILHQKCTIAAFLLIISLQCIKGTFTLVWASSLDFRLLSSVLNPVLSSRALAVIALTFSSSSERWKYCWRAFFKAASDSFCKTSSEETQRGRNQN